MSKGLPEFCYVLCNLFGAQTGERIALVRRGEQGYWPVTSLPDRTKEEAIDSICKANISLGVNGIQAFCMKTGSLFGFDVPGADPEWVREHMPEIDAADASGEGGGTHVR